MTAAIDWIALREARRNARLGTLPALAHLIGGSEAQALCALAEALELPCWDSADFAGLVPALDRLPLARAQALHCALLRPEHGPMVAVLHDPLDDDLWAQLGAWAGGPLRYALASVGDIDAYLRLHEDRCRAMDTLQTGQPASAGATPVPELTLARLSSTTSPAVRLVDSTLYDALRAGASDVHIECTPSGLAIRYRVDGMLDRVAEVAGATLAEQSISRLKVLAQLDIAERRVPQDGSFRVRMQGRDVDLRLSIMPGVHGEDAVVRILDKEAMLRDKGELNIAALGFDAAAGDALRELLEAAHGMLLVTGPTGSGKTTTLYAALTETRTGRDKVVTIEDPVEYQLPGVLQIPVNEKKGLTFARGLRSVLRHDPDTIMVGEIRDRETAEIAVQSALTGHLVLTTVHANNVFDVFGRLAHMGLDPYALASAVNGIWAQRLLRLNCPRCTRPEAVRERELARLGLPAADLAGIVFQRGRGCADCRGSGYKGRQAVAQVLRLDDELREMVVARGSLRQLKNCAHGKGTRSLTEAALDLLRAGKTSLVEVRRATVAS